MAEMTTLTAAIYREYSTRIDPRVKGPSITSRFEEFFDEVDGIEKVTHNLKPIVYVLLLTVINRNTSATLISSSIESAQGSRSFVRHHLEGGSIFASLNYHCLLDISAARKMRMCFKYFTRHLHNHN